MNKQSITLLRMLYSNISIHDSEDFAFIQSFAGNTFIRLCAPALIEKVHFLLDNIEKSATVQIVFPRSNSFACFTILKGLLQPCKYLYLDFFVKETINVDDRIEIYINTDRFNQLIKVVDAVHCSYSPKRNLSYFYTLNGPHKSGTTLLEACFNSNPNTLCLHENNILSMKNINQNMLYSRVPPFLTIFDIATSSKDGIYNGRDLIINLIRLIFGSLGYDTVGDRSPNIFASDNKNFDNLALVDAKHVFITRDIVSTFLSLVDHAENMNALPFEKSSLYTGDLSNQAEVWIKAECEYISNQRNYIQKFCKLYPDSTYFLDYSSFITNKKEKCEALFRFIGIKYNNIMLDEIIHTTSLKSMLSGSYSKLGNPTKFIISSSRKDQIISLSPSVLNLLGTSL